SMRRYMSIISILRRIGNAYHKSFPAEALSINFDIILLRLVIPELGERCLNITSQPPMGTAGKNSTDMRIKPYSGHIKELPAINSTRINPYCIQLIKPQYRLLIPQGNIERPRKAITRPAGNDPHLSI